MGDANWWLPGWLDRVLPHVDVEGTSVFDATRGVLTIPDDLSGIDSDLDTGADADIGDPDGVPGVVVSVAGRRHGTMVMTSSSDFRARSGTRQPSTG